MPKAPAKRPDAYRSLYLAVQEILNDEAPSNAAHREWLLTRLEATKAMQKFGQYDERHRQLLDNFLRKHRRPTP
jgi:hypothetical protein